VAQSADDAIPHSGAQRAGRERREAERVADGAG
jgi:hypothetical protein